MDAPAVHIGIVVFPGMLQMDCTGPYGVFMSAPGAVVDLLWKNTDPVRSSDNLLLAPNRAFADCSQLDLVCVPGGAGILALLEDSAVHAFLRSQADKAHLLASVCTGALVLGAAGLLVGYKATTHWQSLEMLAEFGAHPVQERVVVDRQRATAAGVSAGIDMALTLVGKEWGPDTACEIELAMEYDPRPPYGVGHPSLAPQELTEKLRVKNAQRQKVRMDAVRKAARRLRAAGLLSSQSC